MLSRNGAEAGQFLGIDEPAPVDVDDIGRKSLAVFSGIGEPGFGGDLLEHPLHKHELFRQQNARAEIDRKKGHGFGPVVGAEVAGSQSPAPVTMADDNGNNTPNVSH
jgi:hypothetical protein